MIAINILILVILIFENGGQICDTASVSESQGFSQYLRRRRTNSNAARDETPTKASGDEEEVKIHTPISEPKRRIFFGLRQPQMTEPQRSRSVSSEKASASQSSSYFSLFYTSAVSGITKALDAIENLEKEFDEQQEKEK